MSDSKDEVIQFKEPIQSAEVEKAFKTCDIQCVNSQAIARRVAVHVSKAIRQREIITRQKIRAFFMRCI